MAANFRVGGAAASGTVGGMGPTAGAASLGQFNMEDLRNYGMVESVLRSQLSNDFLLVAELYSTWVGTCAATKPMMARLSAESIEAQQESAQAAAAEANKEPNANDDDDVNPFDEGAASTSSGTSTCGTNSAATGGGVFGEPKEKEKDNTERVPLRIAAVDPERILKSLDRRLKAELQEGSEGVARQSTEYMSWQSGHRSSPPTTGSGVSGGATGGRPNFHQFVKRVLGPWRMTVIPVFILLRKGQLLAVIEGPNAPQLESAVKHYTIAAAVDAHGRSVQLRGPAGSGGPGLGGGVGLTTKEEMHYAFMIQTAWRRKKQLGRIGMYLDGTFYTHEQVRVMREKEERLRLEEEHHVKRTACATQIQKIWRGYIFRLVFNVNRKTLLQKTKMSLSRQRGKKESLYATTKLPGNVERKFKALRKHLITGVALNDDELALIHKKIKFGAPAVQPHAAHHTIASHEAPPPSAQGAGAMQGTTSALHSRRGSANHTPHKPPVTSPRRTSHQTSNPAPTGRARPQSARATSTSSAKKK